MIKFLINKSSSSITTTTTTTSSISRLSSPIIKLNLNNNNNNNNRYYSKSCCSGKNKKEGEKEKEIRVRYAPSPTGYLHLGGLRTALFNYLFAKKNNGKFILRIEDTDRTRFVEGSAKNLAGCLEWAGIPYDEGPERPGDCGPYIQSERLPIYKEHAERLIKSGHAYHCFCSSERLSTSRLNLKNQYAMSLYDRHCLKLSKEEIEKKLAAGESHTIRLKIPNEMDPNDPMKTITKFNDIVKGNVQFNNQLIDDQVLMKSDGFPTYHLASVVDDHLMGITHIIRGEEWLNSTPKHIILYEAFGWKPPKLAHVPLLLNSDKSKLSKRQGDVSVDSYMSKGYLPESLVNFVALLGWSPSDAKEIFTLPELIDSFTLEGINKSGSVVDMNRLDWLNVCHIRKQLEEGGGNKKSEILLKIKNQLIQHLEAQQAGSYSKADLNNDEYLLNSINCVKERVHLIEDFNNLLTPFFIENINYSSEEAIKMKSKVWKQESSSNNINLFINRLKELDGNDKLTFNHSNIYEQLKKTTSQDIYKDQVLTDKELTTKTNQLMSNLRYLLLGSPVGGGIPLAIETLGKEKTINRLIYGLNLNK